MDSIRGFDIGLRGLVKESHLCRSAAPAWNSELIQAEKERYMTLLSGLHNIQAIKNLDFVGVAGTLGFLQSSQHAARVST